MDEFYKDLAAVLKKHRVAIVSKPNGFDDSVIGFQSNYGDNYWTRRHHITGCDAEDEAKEQPND